MPTGDFGRTQSEHFGNVLVNVPLPPDISAAILPGRIFPSTSW